MAGRGHAGKAERQDMRVGAEIERQRRQLAGIDLLEFLPERGVVRLAHHFQVVEDLIHAGVAEPRVVLTGPAVLLGRDHG